MIHETVLVLCSLLAFGLGTLAGWSLSSQKATFYRNQCREDRRLARFLISQLLPDGDTLDELWDELAAPPEYDAYEDAEAPMHSDTTVLDMVFNREVEHDDAG